MADTVFVLVEHPVTGARGQIPIDTVDTWTAKGYVVIDDPEEDVTTFKAQVLASVQDLITGVTTDASAAVAAKTASEAARDVALSASEAAGTAADAAAASETAAAGSAGSASGSAGTATTKAGEAAASATAAAGSATSASSSAGTATAKAGEAATSAAAAAASESAAAGAQAGAEDARDDAVAAKTAAEAVGSTNDAIIAGRLADDASATYAALDTATADLLDDPTSAVAIKTSASIGAFVLTGVQAVRTTDGALAANKHNPVSAATASRAVTLADATSTGQLVAVSKADASPNPVSVTVSKFEGATSSVITLDVPGEAVWLASKSDGSWWVILRDRGVDIDVERFGATTDETADNHDAIQAALDYAAAVTTSALVPSRFLRQPRLKFRRGVYRITEPFTAITTRGITVAGEGSMNTAIYFDSTTDAPVFDIGTFSTTPADIFAGTQDAEFKGIRIHKPLVPGGAGSRTSQGIRSSGGGSLRLTDVAVAGFQYGINSPYGGDFNTYRDVTAENCDVGCYQGPGGQQFEADNFNAYFCVEAMVLDRPGHVLLTKPIFNSPKTAGLVLEATSDTATRQLSSFSMGGTSYQSQIVLDTPWFEGNAGGVGVDAVPTNFIEVRNGGSDSYRDLTIRNPMIVAGEVAGGGGKTTTAFLANLTGAVQRVRIVRPVFMGAMTRWFTTPTSNYELDDPRITTGYTAPAYANNTSAWVVRTAGAGADKVVTGALPWTDTYEQADGSHGVRVTYDQGGIIKFGFLNAGSYLTRMGLDVQNTRFYFGDPSSGTAMSVARAAAMPTSGTYGIGSFVHNTAPSVSAGKVLLGWLRLTSGSAHVAGTDWTPVYGTTT